jgi:hypothetical protein
LNSIITHLLCFFFSETERATEQEWGKIGCIGEETEVNQEKEQDPHKIHQLDAWLPYFNSLICIITFLFL